MRQHGARVALDDFGIGYSSLRYVHELEFDALKVDRSFITPLANNERSRRIVKTVVDMCANLDIDCVLEGIETESQRDAVMALGGRLMQGYFFARPDREPRLVRFGREYPACVRKNNKRCNRCDSVNLPATR